MVLTKCMGSIIPIKHAIIFSEESSDLNYICFIDRNMSHIEHTSTIYDSYVVFSRKNS